MLARANLVLAWKRVKANRGSAGVDGLTIAATWELLKTDWPRLREELQSGTLPAPAGTPSANRQAGWRGTGIGVFWVKGDGATPIPRDAFSMQGAGGQSATIIPSHQLVIVRLGKYRGEQAGDSALTRAMAILMEAVQP